MQPKRSYKDDAKSSNENPWECLDKVVRPLLESKDDNECKILTEVIDDDINFGLSDEDELECNLERKNRHLFEETNINNIDKNIQTCVDLEIYVDVLKMMDVNYIEGRLGISYVKSMKLHSKMKNNVAFSDRKIITNETHNKVDQLIESINHMRQEVFFKPSTDLSQETEERFMKLRLNQLAATTQIAALKNINQHLDMHGDDIHVVPSSSIIDNLSTTYEKKAPHCNARPVVGMKFYLKHFRQETMDLDSYFAPLYALLHHDKELGARDSEGKCFIRLTDNDVLNAINHLLKLSPDGTLSDANVELLEMLTRSLSTGLRSRSIISTAEVEHTLIANGNHRATCTRHVDEKRFKHGDCSIKAYENRLSHKNWVIFAVVL